MSEKHISHNMNKKVIIILSLIFTSIVLISFLYSLVQLVIQPSSRFVIENGKIYQEETTYGYIVREEKVLYGNNYKNGLVEIKTEGTKVAKGENVFRYYSNNEEELKEKIAKLDNQIQQALEGQTEVYSADIQILDKQIEGYLEKAVSNNNLSDISEYKASIGEVLIKKAKIAGELSPSGSHISSLIEQRRKLEEELNNGQEYIKTDMCGMVSYKVDGLEEKLKPEDFEKLDKKTLENYNLKTGQMIPTSTEAGKIVNNYKCYIISFLNSEEAHNANVGKTITLRLSDGSEIETEIEQIIQQESGDVMIIFATNKAVEKLISYRKISIDIIWWSDEGLKVPNSAIIEEGGISKIIRNRAGYKDEILVKVLNNNKNYSIIENYSTKELIELGYDEKEIKSMKSISLYDEILVNHKK